jgi:hypothetical protein
MELGAMGITPTAANLGLQSHGWSESEGNARRLEVWAALLRFGKRRAAGGDDESDGDFEVTGMTGPLAK